MKTKMTVRDFIAQDIEIDIYDDVTDEIGVCFTGPMELTAEGEEHFKELLDLDVEIKDAPGWGDNAYVLIDGDDGDAWEDRLEIAKEFFYAAAGYCTDDEYHLWFRD